MERLLNNSKIIVCVGSGGVGKTTVAAALAVQAAQSGLKVLVLTIDPAKRLAQTLGIEGSLDVTRVPGQHFKGELFASVIDHKKTFDDFVIRASQKSQSIEKILNNKLYHQLSTNLSGSQEFTALEKLYTCYESGLYDLIILDTPPTKHAIDFLQAPQKLAALFSENVTKWFRDPEGKKSGLFMTLLHSGTKQVLKVLESLTGNEFIRELGDFFLNIQGWQDRLYQRTIDVHRLLISNQTRFVLVTSFDQAKLREADYFAREIRKGGYHLAAVILNRAFPDWLEAQEGSTKVDGSHLLKVYEQMKTYYNQRQGLYSTFAAGLPGEVMSLQIPDLMTDISDLKGLEELCALIKERSPSA